MWQKASVLLAKSNEVARVPRTVGERAEKVFAVAEQAEMGSSDAEGDLAENDRTGWSVGNVDVGELRARIGDPKLVERAVLNRGCEVKLPVRQSTPVGARSCCPKSRWPWWFRERRKVKKRKK